MKHGGMGDIRIGAVNPPGRKDPDRRRLLFHDPDLDRRGMGAQNDIVFDIKRVLHIPGGMIFGNIQGLEIIVIQFDFRTFDDGKPKSGKDRTDLISAPA